MGKGEIAHHKQLLLFPQCSQKACFPGASKGVTVWEWVNPYRKIDFCKTSGCKCNKTDRKMKIFENFLVQIHEVSLLMNLACTLSFNCLLQYLDF